MLPEKLIRNTLFNIGGHAWNIAVALVMTPFIVASIGIERFGVWALVGILTNFIGLFDFGIGASFIKYISEYQGRNDQQRTNRVVVTGIVFYGLLALPLLGAGCLFLDPLVNILNVPSSLESEARQVFFLAIALFAMSNLIRPMSALQPGLQRMDITNKLLLALSIPQVIGTVVVLKLGFGLSGLMANQAFVLALAAIMNFSIAFRLLPDLKFRPALFDAEIFGRLFGYGYKIQLSMLAGWIQGQLDRFLVARFLDVTAVAHYSTAAGLAGRVKELPLLLVSAVLPAASELEARKETAGLRELYLRTMKYVVLSALPITSLVIIAARPFIILWLGTDFDPSIMTLRILMFGYLLNLLTGPGATILNGSGKPQYAMRSALIALPINLILSIVLVMKIGYMGVVLGTTVSLGVSSVYFIIVSHRVMTIPLSLFCVRILLRPLLVSLAVSAFTALLLRYGSTGWSLLAAVGFIHITLIALLLTYCQYFDDFDRKLLYNGWRRISGK